MHTTKLPQIVSIQNVWVLVTNCLVNLRTAWEFLIKSSHVPTYCAGLYIYKYIYTHTYIHIYIYIYIHIYISYKNLSCLSVCLSICLPVCLHVTIVTLCYTTKPNKVKKRIFAGVVNHVASNILSKFKSPIF